MNKIIPIVQSRLQKGEREDAIRERRLAGLAREQQSAFFKQEQEHRKVEMKRMVDLYIL